MRQTLIVLLLGTVLLATSCRQTTTTPPPSNSNDTIVYNPSNKLVDSTHVSVAPTSTQTDSAATTAQPVKTEPLKNAAKLSAREAQNVAEPSAKLVIDAMAKKDMAALSKYVHPTKGVRFSPYSSVNLKTDRVLKTSDIANATQDKKTHTWGEFDGSGEPINLTFAKYYQQFVYNYDYQKLSKQRGFNRSIGTGNSINNIKTAYPNGVAVEYYVPGQNPDYGGMDWGSLTLVFEQHTDNNWYLVGVIHGQWTS
jgi:hypothetical protein